MVGWLVGGKQDWLAIGCFGGWFWLRGWLATWLAGAGTKLVVGSCLHCWAAGPPEDNLFFASQSNNESHALRQRTNPRFPH